VLLLVFLAAGCASPPPDTTAADLMAINTVRNDYVAAINAGDATRAGLLYTSSAVRMLEHQPALNGTDAIIENYRGSLAAFKFDMSLSPEETRVAGNWGFDRGQFMLHLTPKEGGAMTIDHGKYLVILQKEGPGVWKIAREMMNSSIPIAVTPAPTAPASPPPPGPPMTMKR